MTNISVYLTFDGNCKEAMNFYKEAMGAELTMQTVGESPMADKMPAEKHDKIMHSSLLKDGTLLLMASDMMMNGEVVQGNTVNLCVNTDTEENVKTMFAKLSEGGEVTHPLKEEFWGALYGDFKDKFGIRWMFNFDKNAKK
jgi:PhnB protein